MWELTSCYDRSVSDGRLTLCTTVLCLLQQYGIAGCCVGYNHLAFRTTQASTIFSFVPMCYHKRPAFECSTADGEIMNRFRQLNRFLCYRYNHVLKTFTHVQDQICSRFLVSGHDQLHSAVAQIPDESGHRVPCSDPVCCPPKTNPLNVSCKQNAFCDLLCWFDGFSLPW